MISMNTNIFHDFNAKYKIRGCNWRGVCGTWAVRHLHIGPPMYLKIYALDGISSIGL